MLIDYVIQLNFYNYLYNLKDYINLILINKLSYKNYNYDIIYKYYLERKFSKFFTESASLIVISYRDCFIRINIFENIMKDNGYELWDENIYYLFWKGKYYK